MILVALIIGLICSAGAFSISIFNLRKMVEKHKTHPTLEDSKFYPIKNTFVSVVAATAITFLTLLGALFVGWSSNNSVITANQNILIGLRDQVKSDPCPRLSGPLSNDLEKKQLERISKECRRFLASLPQEGYDGKPLLPHSLSCAIVESATGNKPDNC